MNLTPILHNWGLILVLCVSRIAMNSSPTCQRPEDGHPPNHNRSFFFQPMPSPHMFVPPMSPFVHPPAFHPYFYPTVEFGGSLYYPVCQMPFPRSYGPQSPMPHTNFRRPYFNSFVARPTFYHSTRFRHYPFRRNMTSSEVQTDTSETNPAQPKRADVITETLPSGGQAAEVRHQKTPDTESTSGSADILQARVVHKRIQGESNETEETSAAVATKNAKAGGYALQKEKIRIECNEGAPSINVWRSFEATVPIYNTPNKNVEEGVQCKVWSVSACESGVPIYGSFEADKIVRKTEVPEKCTLPALSQGEMLLDSNKSPEAGFESSTKDEVSCYPGMHDKMDSLQCKTNKSCKFPTSEFVHEALEKAPLQRNSSGRFKRDGKVKNAINKDNGKIISAEPLNEEKICEVLKSDASLESAEEYIPSASVLAWLQDQAQSNCWKDGPQMLQHHPRVLDVSFEEISSKDEESSFSDAMHGRHQLSYSHLMRNAHSSFYPAISTCNDQIGNKTVGNQHLSEREQFCSCCKIELVKGKGIKHVCRNNSATWNTSSKALSEMEELKKGQFHEMSASRGRRRCRRISRESSRSNGNKKTRYSSDSIEVSEEQDYDSRAENPGKAKVGGFSNTKISRRSPKISPLQFSNRLQQEKARAKKRQDMIKYIINQREQTKLGTEHQERRKSGQISKLERKQKGGRRHKYARKTMSVQNASEDSVDEYWNKVGARPKSATQSFDDADSEKLEEIKPSCKSVPRKRATQKLNEMDFWNLSDLHAFQGNALRRGRAKCAKKPAPLYHVKKEHLDAIKKCTSHFKCLHNVE